MYTKFIKTLTAFSMLLTLTACTVDDENDCLNFGSEVIVEDLVKITPLQPIYNQGDIITIKINIPATNTYFGVNPRNIYSETQDSHAQVVMDNLNNLLLEDNELTIIKGIQGQNAFWFEFPYNSESKVYELELEIKLNKIGNYSFHTDNKELIEIKGKSNCTVFEIGTNFEGRNAENAIEFTVQ